MEIRSHLVVDPSISPVMQLPDPDWYLDNVLVDAEPGRRRTVDAAAEWRGWWRTQARLAHEQWPCLQVNRHGFVALTSELRAAGVQRHTARRLVRSGQWSAPQAGTVAVVDPAAHPGTDPLSTWAVSRRRHALRASAAARRNEGFAVAGSSAALLHGLPVMSVAERPTLTAPSCHHHYRVAGIKHTSLENWYGIPVTKPARTLVDVARHDHRSGLMAADAALRDKLVTSSAIAAELAEQRGWVGVTQARAILGLADPLAESPLESLTRLALHDDGFPPPQLQVEIRVPGRWAPYRVDLLWEAQRIVLECDGRSKNSEAERWREKQRDLALQRLGWWVERVTWADVVHNWPAVAARLRDLLGC